MKHTLRQWGLWLQEWDKRWTDKAVLLLLRYGVYLGIVGTVLGFVALAMLVMSKPFGRGLICGMVLGTFCGILVMALCVSSKNADLYSEIYWLRHREEQRQHLEDLMR